MQLPLCYHHPLLPPPSVGTSRPPSSPLAPSFVAQPTAGTQPLERPTKLLSCPSWAYYTPAPSGPQLKVVPPSPQWCSTIQVILDAPECLAPLPYQQVELPTHLALEPTQPVVIFTKLVEEPTQPVVLPSLPVAHFTQPVVLPTQMVIHPN